MGGVNNLLLAQHEHAEKLTRLDDLALAILARDNKTNIRRSPTTVLLHRQHVLQDIILPRKQ